MEIRTADPSLKNVEVAKLMGMTQAGLKSCINKAIKEGWLKFDDPLSRIEHELIPKVIDNLNFFLDKKDKTVTLETAKCTVFKAYQE